jgi:hypothetical protein
LWKAQCMLPVVIDVDRLASTPQLGQRTCLTPPPPLTNALKASDMAAETLKKRESDGEGTEWREN